MNLVYFIRAGESNRVKIGTTSDFLGRMAALQSASGVELHLLGTLCGGGAHEERGWHRYYAHKRLHGEWFEFTAIDFAEIADVIERDEPRDHLPIEHGRPSKPLLAETPDLSEGPDNFPLREILKRTETRQAALARHLAVTRMTVWEWVHGKEPIPRRRAAQIALLLGAWPEEARDA